jgi:hypothetical protein
MSDAQIAHGAVFARHVPSPSNWIVYWRTLRHILGFARPRNLELTAAESSWGLLPQLSLGAGAVLVFIALSGGFASGSQALLQIWFWGGVWLLLLPIVLRLAWPFVSRWERIGLLVLATIALYTLKMLSEPAGFRGFDEFLHWRSAQDILVTGQLFTPNPLLPIAPAYPALEIVTTALANMTGLSIFAIAAVLVGLLRILFICSLFLLFEQIVHSTRLSAVACLIYMSNSNYAVFDASFAYESLGVVLLVVILLAEARGRINRKGAWIYRYTVAIPLIVALALTHHGTAFLAVVFLAGLLGLSVLNRGRPMKRVGGAALLAVAAVSPWAWSLAMNIPIGYYLGPGISGGLSDLYHTVTTLTMAHKPFAATDGSDVPPLWLRLTAFVGVVIVCVALATGFFRTLALAGTRLSWGRFFPSLTWTNSRLVLLTVLTIGYPISMALRLTESGWELGSRIGPFVYLGVGPVVAIALADFWQKPATNRYVAGATGIALSIVLIGGVFVGWGSDQGISPHYRVAADASSIEPMGIGASKWTRRWLGEDRNFAADRTNQVLLATYGRQQVVTGEQTGTDVSDVLFSEKLGPGEVNAIKVGELEYLLVDLRLTQALPVVGVYFSKGEPPAIHEVPPEPEALLKFNSIKRVGRPFDNGFIIIYDVTEYKRALLHARR